MRLLVGIFFILAARAAGATLPLPDRCLDRLGTGGLCVDAWEDPLDPGTAQIEGYVIVYKSDYPTLTAAAERFLDLGKINEYYDAAGFEKIHFLKSVMLPEQEMKDAQGRSRRLRRNYFNVYTQIPVIGKQYARGVSNYIETTENPTQAITYKFDLSVGPENIPGEAPLPQGHEGLVKQSGDLTFTECAGYNAVCGPEDILVVYRIRLRYKIALLPKYTALVSQEQIAALLTGMYLR